MRLQDFILNKTLQIFQHLPHLRNIYNTFKECYGFYEQLRQFCQDTSFIQPVCGILEQTEPPPDEYALEIWKQIKWQIQTPPP